jgi:ferredoxin
MRVIIDADICQGHLRCAAVAPDLFQIDEYGHGLSPGRDLTSDESALAHNSVATCPESAIRIEP